MIGYEIEHFSFLFIEVLFSTGNVKKNVFTVSTVPIITIDGFVIININNKHKEDYIKKKSI